MPISVGRKQVRLAMGCNAIYQRTRTVAGNNRQRQPLIEILTGNDLVQAILDEETGPLLQLVVVNRYYIVL